MGDFSGYIWSRKRQIPEPLVWQLLLIVTYNYNVADLVYICRQISVINTSINTLYYEIWRYLILSILWWYLLIIDPCIWYHFNSELILDIILWGIIFGALKELRGHKVLTSAYNILVYVGGHAELYIGNWSPIFKRSMSGFITCEAVMLHDHVTFDASFDYNLLST